MKLLDGRALSSTIRSELKVEAEELSKLLGRRPRLAAVLVGDSPASEVYVRNKILACEKASFDSTLIRKGADCSESELLEIIHELNNDDTIDGFIVQLPLPKGMDEAKLNLAIDPKKDVDGFHPMNIGRMVNGFPSYFPATPYGIVLLLERYNIPTEGKKCVVVGRSNIVGTPISILLSRKKSPGNATVTLVHSRTQNKEKEIADADIIIAAIGIPHFIKPGMVKEGAVVIDVGINKIEDASKKRGYRLVGDVDFEGVSPKTSYITPVPGGVGPMTVTALLMNTLKAAKREIYV